MRIRVPFVLLSILIVVMLIVSERGANPDWKALYSAHLNRKVIELDESFINQKFEDPTEGASLTRIAWAKLDTGSIVFLGLPPYGIPKERVIERTVILTEEEWKSAISKVLGEPIVGWSIPNQYKANSIRVYVNNRRDIFFEFYYLPRGWELRTVRVGEVLKPFQ